MFEFLKIKNEFQFRQLLASNPWLKKFLLKYYFEEGFIYFDEKRFLSSMLIKSRKESFPKNKSFKQLLLQHVKQQKYLMVKVPMHLQSFQYLLCIMGNLKKNIRSHYDILIPFLVQLDLEDGGYVIDVLQNKLKISAMQKRILQGG